MSKLPTCKYAVRAAVLMLAALFLSVLPASAQERLCDPSFEDCRQPILDLINNETVELDVGFWYMIDSRYNQAIVNRWNAGVPVRILCDPRGNSVHSGNGDTLNQFAAAGIPMRYKLANGILHWKTMIFAGQNKVQFGGANYDPFSFVYVTPFQNYIDEVIYFSDDPAVVNSFKTEYDNLWTDTTNYGNYANINGALTRSYPTSSIDPDLNFPPDLSNWWVDYGNRSEYYFNHENQKIDVAMFRITNAAIADNIISQVARGIPVRLLHDTSEYRDNTRFWDAYNADRLYMGGVQMKTTKHDGINHQKSVICYGQGLTIFGSSNWTSPSFNSQQEHNYFTTKAWTVEWLANQYERKWNSQTEYEPFIPLPPDQPVNISPTNAATGQPTSVTLTWEGGYWAHKYDIFFGTTSNPPLIASNVFTGSPGPSQSETFTVSGLVPGVTYHWSVTGKTMADNAATGNVWSFTVGGTPPGTSGAPAISSISPNSAPATGGTSVTIAGTNFASGATVTFGFIPATNVTVNSASSITATIPAHAAGAADVVVTNPNGQTGTAAGGFTYTPVAVPTGPHASVVSPGSGGPSGGTSITITGFRFSPGATVTIAGATAGSVSVVNSYSITATTPPGVAGPANVVVTNPDGQSSTLTSGFTYLPSNTLPPPSIASVSPNSGSSTGGTQVTIAGSNFSFGAVVTIGGVQATNIIVVNSGTITVTAPPNSTSAANVVVTNYDNQTSTLTGGFTYTAQNPPPTISSISPTNGVTGGGTPVTITGTRFATGASVTIGGAAATNVSVASSTSITATTPAHAAGTADVKVTNPDGQTATLAGGFTYTTSNPPPVVSSISPTSGSTAGGTSVTVSGTSFVSGATLTIGGVPVSNLNVASSTTITGTTGAHAAGAVDVVVTNPDGQVGTLTAGYSYTTAASGPTISSVSPNSGPPGGGTAVTISGSGFVSGATVSFGGTAATNVNFVSASSLTATTPAHSGGAVTVVVTNPNGQSGSLNSAYTYNGPPAPAAVSPNSGPPGGGAQVTISGTGFVSGATVSFGSAAASSVTVVSSTSITATTPANPAGSVTVTVTNPDGESGGLSNGYLYSGETVLLADDFNGASINTSSWMLNNLFSGNTDINTAVKQTGGQLLIGPLTQSSTGSNYNGLRSATTYNFTGAYCYVQLVQAPAANTAADAMLTIGSDGSNFYRIYVEAGKLTVQKKIGGAKSTLFTTTYNSANHQYLRIRHDSAAGNVVFETAPSNSGVPGSWTAVYSEAWNSSVALTSMIFEIKAGTWQAEANPPGTTVFDNFRAAIMAAQSQAPPPSVSSISPNSGPAAGGTSVTITGTAFSSGATVTIGGSAATSVSVNSSTSITAVTPAHAAGAADVKVTNADGQSGTLASGFTYTASNPAPTVSSVSPSSGSTAGGTAVTISGTGFAAGATVIFGSAAASGVTVVSSTSITATTPANTAGSATVTVTNPDGQSGSLANGYLYSGETVLLADDFNGASVNTTNWTLNNLFSGFTDTGTIVKQTGGQLLIGPLTQSSTGSNYNGLRSAATYNFTGAYCYVQLVQPPAANTAADAMLTIGSDSNNFYRIYVEAGKLIVQKKIAGAKATPFTTAYRSTNHQFLRIRHDSTAGNVIFETAPNNGGAPGSWTTVYSEAWSSSVVLTSIIFEIKAGVWQAEANAPGTPAFDNFHAAKP